MIPKGSRSKSTAMNSFGIKELAETPRWSVDEVNALEGHCSGEVLYRWAENVERRWGKHALMTIRDGMGDLGPRVPDAPNKGDWFPIACQIRITDLIIDELLDGDAEELEPLLLEDTHHNGGIAMRFLLRRVGPARVFRNAHRIHPRCYDVGSVSSTLNGTHATVVCQGASLFANPTWRMLQLMGHRVLLAHTGQQVISVSGEALGDDGFKSYCEWE